MTVSTSTNSVVYRGNGATTQFAVPFKVLDEEHLVARRRVYATGVIDYTYLGTDYTYSGLGDDAGTLTLAGTALDDDYELVIERIVPYTQDLDIVNAGGFYPETVEEQLDLIIMGVQQIADRAGRGAYVPVGEGGLALPKASDRAGKFFAFDAGGNFVASSGTGTDGALRTDLGAPGGGALVSVNVGVADASSMSLDEFASRQPLNLMDACPRDDWEAIEAGTSVLDHTAYLQNAMDDGRRIIIPAGTFFVNLPAMRSGLKIEGEDEVASILRPYSKAANILRADAGSAGARINGLALSKLTFLGWLSAAFPFSEHAHLVNWNGVYDAWVEHCRFVAMRGDGLYIGSGSNDPSPTERHNEKVRVRDCTFDGTGTDGTVRDNRNGISIIDGVNVKVLDSEFKYLTRPGQPGPIDIEPDGNAYHVVEDIEIAGNEFRANGGASQVNIIVPSTVPAARGIRVHHNDFSAIVAGAVFGAIGVRDNSATATDWGIEFTDNYCRSGVNIAGIFGVKGALIARNTFDTFTGSIIIGFTDAATDRARGVSIFDNRFILCGTIVGGQVILVSYSSETRIEGNRFDRGGPTTTAGVAIRLHSGATTNGLRIVNNEVLPADNQNTWIAAGGATQTPAASYEAGNRLGAATTAGVPTGVVLASGLTPTNPRGTAVLVAGAVTVAAPGIVATSHVRIGRKTDGGTVGASYSVTITGGTGFAVAAKDGAGSAQAADTSTLWYEVEPS